MTGKYDRVAYYPGCALEGTGHGYNRSTKAVGDALDGFPRGRVVREVVLGLLEVVVAAVARRHHRLEPHVIRNREIAG